MSTQKQNTNQTAAGSQNVRFATGPILSDEQLKPTYEELEASLQDARDTSEHQYKAWLEMQSQAMAANTKVRDFRIALKSIASNTCCDKCREAALVAKAALAQEAR